MCKLFIYLLRESYSKYSDEKEKTRNTLFNAKCPRGMLEGNFIIYGVYASLSSNSEVLDSGRPIHYINTFPIIAQHSKGTHNFHRVVGLVVNMCQWCNAHSI